VKKIAHRRHHRCSRLAASRNIQQQLGIYTREGSKETATSVRIWEVSKAFEQYTHRPRLTEMRQQIYQCVVSAHGKNEDITQKTKMHTL